MLKSAQGHQKKSLSHPKLKKILGADVLNLLWIIGAAAIVNPIRVESPNNCFCLPLDDYSSGHHGYFDVASPPADQEEGNIACGTLCHIFFPVGKIDTPIGFSCFGRVEDEEGKNILLTTFFGHGKFGIDLSKGPRTGFN